MLNGLRTLGLDSLVECFSHIFIPQPPLFLSIISSHLYHLPSHSYYVLSLSLTFKQLINVNQNSPPCYGGLLHSFSVKIHAVFEHKQLYINMTFTYNTWWHKVLYEKLLVTQLVKEVSYLFWHVYPEDHNHIHNTCQMKPVHTPLPPAPNKLVTQSLMCSESKISCPFLAD